jgi:gamma-butyrobetaine dioxygenase/trimethyllysine dioxygenase
VSTAAEPSRNLDRVDLHDEWLRVHFREGGHADFHFRWLRHNAGLERHPTTGELTIDSSELPDGIRPTDVAVEGDALRVRWSDGAGPARYAAAWLREHAYAADRVAVAPPPSDLGRIEVRGVADLATIARRAYEGVRRDGVVVVRGAGSPLAADPQASTEPLVDAFTALGLTIVPTHFGRIEDLRTDNTTNQNTDQLGYTDATIELHTDQPFLDRPPRFQVLQGIRSATTGGDNAIVDARAAAEHLRSLDARAVELLSTVPVRFHRVQKGFQRTVVAPILQVGPGDAFQVRYSYFTMAPHQVPFAQMTEWYRAYDRFARLVRDPANQYRFVLEPGDFVLYDNFRMLHARVGFTGPRWVRGIYFDP